MYQGEAYKNVRLGLYFSQDEIDFTSNNSNGSGKTSNKLIADCCMVFYDQCWRCLNCCQQHPCHHDLNWNFDTLFFEINKGG